MELSRSIARIEADRKGIRARAFNDVDVFVLPTMPITTVEGCGQDPLALSPAYTSFANYYALPAISVPRRYDQKGLPLGLQFVGTPQEDRAVLAVAHEYQSSASFAKCDLPLRCPSELQCGLRWGSLRMAAIWKNDTTATTGWSWPNPPVGPWASNDAGRLLRCPG